MSEEAIIEKIMFGATLTINYKQYVAHMDNNLIEVDYKFAELLSYFGIIEQDSGNWETGDKHYLLSDRFVRNRKIKLNYIIEHLEMMRVKTGSMLPLLINSWDTDKRFLRLKDALENIKLKYLRKEKLEKIKKS